MYEFEWDDKKAKSNVMRKEYDFSKSIRNPYAAKLKKQVTIRLDQETIGYFQQLASELDLPYQKLITLFLRDCAANRKKPSMKWQRAAS